MTIHCCSHCYQQIADKDANSAGLWTQLCSYFVMASGIFSMRETQVPWTIPHMRLLEKLGFILTKDGADGIDVRVNGYDIQTYNEDPLDYVQTFCIDREKHYGASP